MTGLSGVLFLAGVAASRSRPSRRVTLTKLSAPVSGEPVAMPAPGQNASTVLAEGSARDCWPWTGGTCNIKPCDGYRKATCTGSILKLCTCPDGCTGADFACHAEKNVLVAEGFSLENAAYSGQYLHVPTTIGLRQVRIGDLDDSGKFALWKVPGQYQGMNRYLIGPTKYPDYVLQTETANQYLGSLWKVVEKDDEGDSPLLPSGDPVLTFWTVCKVNGHVRLGVGNPDFGYLWAYSHRGTWLIFSWIESLWGEPDDRAEWISAPVLMEKLEDCPQR